MALFVAIRFELIFFIVYVVCVYGCDFQMNQNEWFQEDFRIVILMWICTHYNFNGNNSEMRNYVSKGTIHRVVEKKTILGIICRAVQFGLQILYSVIKLWVPLFSQFWWFWQKYWHTEAKTHNRNHISIHLDAFHALAYSHTHNTLTHIYMRSRPSWANLADEFWDRYWIQKNQIKIQTR